MRSASTADPAERLCCRPAHEERPGNRRGGESTPHAREYCEQASHGGELAAAVDVGAVGREDVTELGAVLIGEAGGRRSAGDITLFDSTGLAIHDLALAKAACAKVDELDLQVVDL